MSKQQQLCYLVTERENVNTFSRSFITIRSTTKLHGMTDRKLGSSGVMGPLTCMEMEVEKVV
jgi:hypothetical protein